MISKLKSIYRIIFPKDITTSHYFEKRITWLPRYSGHKNIDQLYTINFDNYKVAMRDAEHSDLSVYNQIFISEEYRIVKEILISTKKDKYKIIDAGANVGYTSLYFALDLNTEIIAIEPSLKNVAVLNKNIELNQLKNRIEVRSNALSSNSTNKYNTNNNFRDGLDWSTTTVLDPNGEINSITINELLLEKKWEIIDLLKIDIEGAESEIFRSEVEFLKNTRIIAIEVHEEFISKIMIENILIEKGFIVFYVGELTVGLNKKLIH
jgi:FkbM family methyltransferase